MLNANYKKMTGYLRELGSNRLKELRIQLRIVRKQIRKVKEDGLIAARGTSIAKYKAKSGRGDYYDYCKFVESGNKTLIHLGTAKSEWVSIFQKAINRREKLGTLEQRKTELTEQILTLTEGLKHSKHS